MINFLICLILLPLAAIAFLFTLALGIATIKAVFKWLMKPFKKK